MSTLGENVALTITADTLGIARAGFGVALVLSHTASWVERTRTYGSLLDVAADFASDTPEYLAARALFSQSPHPEQLMIGRAANKPTQRYQINIAAVAANTVYSVQVDGTGVTSTLASWTTPSADLTIASVDATANTFTFTAHGMTTGDGPYRVSNSGGGLPSSLTVDTNYWVIVTDANTFQLATSKANALATTPIDISTAGTGTQTLRRVQNDVICAQLVQALNAVVGANYTATQTTGAGETDYVVVTANAAANWFSLAINTPTYLKIAQTHAATASVSNDLDAILLESNDWYALITTFNSPLYVLAAAAWVESNGKLYVVDVNETDAITTAVSGSTDTLGELFALSYNRTAGCYHPSPNQMFSAAWLGRVLPDVPGSETWKFKTLAGVTPVSLTGTHRTNLRARKANTYQTIAGVNKTWEGTVAGGSFGFIDVTRGLDWIQDDMTKGVFEAVAGPEKVPYTDAGVAIIRNEVKASLKRAVRNGIIDDSFTIEVPKVADISAGNKALRTLPDVKWSAVLQGAIHKVTISGVVSV